MRLLFANPQDPVETAAKAAMLAAIERFWKAFAARSTATLAARRERRQDPFLAPFMKQQLGAIEPNLIWEIAPGLKEGEARLTISTEGARHLRPLVGLMLDGAPKLQEWEFYPRRMAEGVRAVTADVKGLTGANVLDFQVTASRDELNYVALEWQAPQGVSKQAALEAAVTATRGILGEELMDTWVGELSVQSVRETRGTVPIRNKNAQWKQVESLAERVADVIAFIDDTLPNEPLLGGSARTRVTVTQTPSESDDPKERSDFAHGLTHRAVSIWHATEEQMPFSSRRHSKHGETFCYLKMEGGSIAPGLEEALGRQLEGGALARVIGSGAGRRYSYIDFVVGELEQAARAIADAARRAGVPVRSWVLFFDDTLRSEWLGVYDETPHPPGVAKREAESRTETS